jgi:oligopeptide transport system ATP-binding protein
VKALQVRDLHVRYPVARGWRRPSAFVQAIRGVSFDLAENETLGIAGESGCGKSSLARALVRLEPVSAGRIRFLGHELLQLNAPDLRHVRRQIQLMFPDSASSLSPHLTVQQLVGEALDLQGIAPRPSHRQQRIQELLRAVGLDAQDARRFPHELTGAQRQCVGLARAMAVEPQLLICDEPLGGVAGPGLVQIVQLLREFQRQQRFACLFLSRDLAVIDQISHRVLILYLGRVVESGPTRQVTRFPRHPYTQALVSSMPTFETGSRRRRINLPGEAPSAAETPSGCPFHPRCPVAEARCRVELPQLREIVSGQQVACHLAR